MSFTEKRELTISDLDGGSSITFSRKDNTVVIEEMEIYTNHAGEKSPLQLDHADRRKLIEFLNMGEYRELSREESW